MHAVHGPTGLNVADAVESSLTSEGNEALIALTGALARAIDAAETPDDLARLSARFLDCLRELGWTPTTRNDDDDGDRPDWARALGGASIRDASRRDA